MSVCVRACEGESEERSPSRPGVPASAQLQSQVLLERT